MQRQHRNETIGTNYYVGTAYIYERTSDGIWNLAQRLEGSNKSGSESGDAVAISNSHAIIGASFEHVEVGAVYIYRRDINGVWEFSQKL